MWGQLLSHLDLPEQYMQPNGQPQPTALTLRYYYNNIIGPFEEAYRKNMAREQQRALQNRAQGAMPMASGGQPRPGMGPVSGTFPPVGTLPAMSGSSSPGMMGQPTMGNALQPTDASLGGINGMPFPPSQALNQTPQGAQLSVNGMTGTPDIRALGSLDASMPDGVSMPMPGPVMNGSVPELEGDGRKRKVEELEEVNGKRARQKLGIVLCQIARMNSNPALSALRRCFRNA
jgi:SWI/SNF chromatin-remodeling complex subunit SWI1